MAGTGNGHTDTSVKLQTGRLQVTSKLHPAEMPLHFPLLFRKGEIWAGSLAFRMHRRMEALQVSWAGVQLNTCSIEAKAMLANGASRTCPAPRNHEILNLSVLA